MSNRKPFEEDIDLAQMVHTLWQGRWVIVAVTLLAIIGSMTYAITAVPWYRADVVISAADSRTNGLNLGQIGGLASLAGINLPGGASGSQMPLAVLQSKAFARQFIEDKNLGPLIFPETWPKDPSAQVPGPRVPDVRDAVRYFTEKVRTVSEEKKTGLVTLSIRWKDPQLAADWANELVTRVNEKLRAQALAESERNTRYLQQQMAETSVVALQQTIGRVLETEMQKFLLAKGNLEFAYKVIDVATVPKVRESPKRALIVVLGTALGFIFSCLFVLARARLAKLPALFYRSF